MKERRVKKLGVWLSVAGALVWLLLEALLFMGVLREDGPLSWGFFLLLEAVVIALGIGLVLAGWKRIQEINGGEEDDLSKY